MRGSVASWVISGRPPEIVSTGVGVYAVWIPTRLSAFIVGASDKPHGPLSAQQIAQLVEKARPRTRPARARRQARALVQAPVGAALGSSGDLMNLV